MTISPSPHRTGPASRPAGSLSALVPRQPGPPVHETDRAAGAVASGAADGRPPVDWLSPTGRLPAVLSAWGRGVLAEVPAGIAWDVVRLPAKLAHETVQRLRAAGAPLGPVLSAPLGAEFFVAAGSADGWDVAEGTVLPYGTLVLMPDPGVTGSRRIGDRGWLVAPAGQPLPRGADLRDAYAEARAHAAETAEDAETTV